MKGGGVTTVGPSLPVMPQTMLKLPVFLDVHFKEEKNHSNNIARKGLFSLEVEMFRIHETHWEVAT